MGRGTTERESLEGEFGVRHNNLFYLDMPNNNLISVRAWRAVHESLPQGCFTT